LSVKLAVAAFLGILNASIKWFAVFMWGRKAAEAKELRHDVERAKEAQRAEDAVRVLTDHELDERLQRFSRKPKPK
jgi:Flp pilus assembly protein TadB